MKKAERKGIIGSCCCFGKFPERDWIFFMPFLSSSILGDRLFGSDDLKRTRRIELARISVERRVRGEWSG